MIIWILIGCNLYFIGKKYKRSFGKVNVAQHAAAVAINANVTVNRANCYQFLVNLRKNKRKVLPNEDLHRAISKSRTCCHNSFEENLPSCYILKMDNSI